MPQDMKTWRRNARRKLLIQLGGKCSVCGISMEATPLVFAHITPLTQEQHDYRCKIGANKRTCLYRREAAEGLLTAKCQSCNIKQSVSEREESKPNFL